MCNDLCLLLADNPTDTAQVHAWLSYCCRDPRKLRVADILEALYDPAVTDSVLSDEDIHVPFKLMDPTQCSGLPGGVLAAMQTLGQNPSIVHAGQLQELVIAAAAAQLLQGMFSLAFPTCMLLLMTLSLHALSAACHQCLDSFHVTGTNQLNYVASMPATARG